MTTTTSKLGADMTDEQLYKLWALALDTTESEFKQKAPAILARQPAAIDRQEASNSPFSNCKFRECDLPGQCRSEGKCHHPRAASPAAPSVEQDERAVIVELLKRARYVRHDDLPAEAQKDAETRAAYGNSSAWQDARDHEQRRLINKAIERLEARAASTSANVAQGAEAWEMDWPEYSYDGMGCGLEDRNITDRYEAMKYGWDEALERVGQILERDGPLYAAPPAQTALTDDARDAARYRWLRRRAFMLDESDDAVTTISLFKDEGPTGEFLDDQIDAALTDAQSASGADHAN